MSLLQVMNPDMKITSLEMFVGPKTEDNHAKLVVACIAIFKCLVLLDWKSISKGSL